MKLGVPGARPRLEPESPSSLLGVSVPPLSRTKKRLPKSVQLGPDGVGDYRPRSNYFPLYIGVGTTSPGATKDLNYLWRAAPHSHPLMARQSYVGEVGWGWQYNQQLNNDALLSNMQIKKTEARVALEDQVTQKFQDQ